MSLNPIGLALSAVNRFAGSELADRLKLRKPAEKIAYLSTRTGFQIISTANRELKQLEKMLPGTRLNKARKPDLFDLSLSDEQQMIFDSLKRLAQDSIRPAAAEADEVGNISPVLWREGLELGLCQYAVPEQFGGVAHEQAPVTSVLIAEALAWGDMGSAAALLAPYSVAQVISRWGTAAQQAQYLPAFASDTPPIASLAVDEPVPLFDPLKLNTLARPDSGGYLLQGTKIAVPLADQADFLIVAAELESVGPRLFLVDRKASGLTLSQNPGMGLRAADLCRVELDQVRVSSEALIGTEQEFNYSEFLDLASLMRCALAVGTSQAVLDYVIPYCNDRIAFGEPISHRQAVAFAIADLAIEISAMRLLTWRAASRAEQGLPFHREAYLARLLCNDKAMLVGSQGVQLLGGHGFVKEHPVERWYRDLRSVAVLHGGVHA